jgi:transcriptional regulator with XRE-family HTH domain
MTATSPSVGEETPPVTENKASSVDAIQTHFLFSSRLKQVMEEKGLSQVELHRACLPLCGDRISISRNAIWAYVRGDRNPTDEKMKILAEALGVEYEWLRDGEKVKDSSVVDETSTEPSVEAASTQPSVEDNATGLSVEDNATEPRAASTEPRATSTPPVVEETSTEPIMITIILQYGADDMDITDLKERCRSAWRAQFGDGAIRSLAVYIKPEDHKAYWVVNEGQSGAVEI